MSDQAQTIAQARQLLDAARAHLDASTKQAATRGSTHGLEHAVLALRRVVEAGELVAGVNGLSAFSFIGIVHKALAGMTELVDQLDPNTSRPFLIDFAGCLADDDEDDDFWCEACQEFICRCLPPCLRCGHLPRDPIMRDQTDEYPTREEVQLEQQQRLYKLGYVASPSCMRALEDLAAASACGLFDLVSVLEFVAEGEVSGVTELLGLSAAGGPRHIQLTNMRTGETLHASTANQPAILDFFVRAGRLEGVEGGADALAQTIATNSPDSLHLRQPNACLWECDTPGDEPDHCTVCGRCNWGWCHCWCPKCQGLKRYCSCSRCEGQMIRELGDGCVACPLGGGWGSDPDGCGDVCRRSPNKRTGQHGREKEGGTM